jgi:probable HAF family extracellular repeat protein
MKTTFLAASAALALSSAALAQAYRITPLGSLGGQSAAWAFDGVGRVVGVSADEPKHNRFHAFVSDGATLTDAGILPGTTNAFAFAASGDTVFGVSFSFQDLTIRALRWRNGTLDSIGDFAPRGANPSGVVTGFLQTTSGLLQAEHACRWSAGTLTDLGTLGGHNSWGYDVADNGWIVGSATTAREAATHAALWTNGSARDLGTLGGANSQAYAISNNRLAVGWSTTASGEKHACAWALDASGAVVTRTDLGSLRRSSFAYGVSDAGDIVGISDSRATLWRHGSIIDLNTTIAPGTGWRLDAATAIDDRGRICGWGTLSGFPQAFLLSCPADFNGDGFVDFFDYDAFVAAFESGDPAADVNGDHFLDFFDYDAFVGAFEAGC